MTKTFYGILIFLTIVIFQGLSANLYSQSRFDPSDRATRKPRGDGQLRKPVVFRSFPVVQSDSSYKILIMADVMYDLLQFTRQGSEYSANFQIEAILVNTRTKKAFSQVWNSEFSLDNFPQTNRRDLFFLTVDSVIVPGGEYEISYRYQDLQGEQRLRDNVKILLPEKPEKFSPSVLFLEATRQYSATPWVIPYTPFAQSGVIPFHKDLMLFTYAYMKGQSTLEASISIHDEASGELVFNEKDTLFSENGIFPWTTHPPFYRWQLGRYIIRTDFTTETDSLTGHHYFDIKWYSRPRSLQNLDYAIEALQPAMDEEQFKELKSGNKEEKLSKFREYWKQFDPDTSTAYNEVLNEYYSRVDSVDRVFGTRSRTYGWKTDPGRIILLYGQPDQIEDNSLRPVQPYLKWTYFLPDRTIHFIFRAVNGRKDYRLIEKEEIPSQ